MSKIDILPNGRKIASSFTAIAAGILTDILFDMLADERFEGTLSDGVIGLFSISKYSFWEKCSIVFFIFLILWTVMTYGIPVIYYVISSWVMARKPKISTEAVLSTYNKCRIELSTLEERAAQGNSSDASYFVLFTDTCQWIVQLYNIFCSGKDENLPSVKAAFRSGNTIYDVEDKISSYEYLEIIKSLKSILDLTNKKIGQSKNEDTGQSKNEEIRQSKNEDTGQSKNEDTGQSKNEEIRQSKNEDTGQSKNEEIGQPKNGLFGEDYKITNHMLTELSKIIDDLNIKK